MPVAARELRRGRDIAVVHEGHGPDVPGHVAAHLGRERGKAAPAGLGGPGAHAKRLVALAAHGAAAARVEQEIRRGRGDRGPDHRSRLHPPGQHDFLPDLPITAQVRRGPQPGGRARQPDKGHQLDLGKGPLARVGAVVAVVPGRAAGQQHVAEFASTKAVPGAGQAKAQLAPQGQLVVDDPVDPDAQFDLVGQIGRLILARDQRPQGQLRIRVAEGGPGQGGGKRIVDAAGLAADPGDLGVKAQPFGPAKEVAVQPVAGQAKPFGRRNLGPCAKAAGLGILDLDHGAQGVVRADGLVLGHIGGAEGPGAAQPAFGLVDLVGVIGLALGDAGDGADPFGANRAVGTVRRDPRRPEGQPRSGRDAKGGIDLVAGMIGGDRLGGDGGLGVAALAPGLDPVLGGFAHHGGAGAGPGREAFGQGVGRGQRRNLGLAEGKGGAGVDRDLDPVDGGGRLQRRQARGLAAIDPDIHLGAEIALFIQRGQNAPVIGLGRGDQVLHVRLALVQGGLRQRGRQQVVAQVIGRGQLQLGRRKGRAEGKRKAGGQAETGRKGAADKGHKGGVPG